MIGIVAFVALAVSAVFGQECSLNGLSQNVAGIASPVSSFSGSVLSSATRSVPSVRSQIVSAPVFLKDGPVLLTQATRPTAGPLVATPAISQSLSPAGSVSSALSSALSTSGSSGFSSAVGSNQVISVAAAVPAYASFGSPSGQVVSSSSSVSLPSFPTVSSPAVQSVSVPSFNLGSAVSSPVFESVSVPSAAQSVSSPVFESVSGSSYGFGSAVSSPSVLSSGLFQSPVSQVVSSAPSVQSSFAPSIQAVSVSRPSVQTVSFSRPSIQTVSFSRPSVQTVQVESPVFNAVSSPLVSGVVGSGISRSFSRNGAFY